MKRPAIFFDRDNTLIVSDGYLGDPSAVRLIDGAAEAVARARAMGFATVVSSNQSGVARGMFGEQDVRAVNARLDEVLRATNAGAIVDRHEFCPFHPDATVEQYRHDSDLRKPKPGMIIRAADALDLDLFRSWVIGDAPRDVAAGHAAGCRTILFRDPTLEASPATQEELTVEPDFVVSTLKEAMDVIEQAMGFGGSDDAQTAEAPREPTMRDHEPARDVVRDLARLESLGQEILQELRRRHEPAQSDFSVPRLMSGIVQVIALAVLFVCYLNRNDASLLPLLVLALVLQTLTIALLLMGRGK